jgi:hypothetical protein
VSKNTKFFHVKILFITLLSILPLFFSGCTTRPTGTPTLAAPTAAPSSSPLPTRTPTATLWVIPTTTRVPTATVTPTLTVTPTFTPVPVISPQAEADAYRLKPWDRSTALQMVEQAGQVPIRVEYADLRQFYQVSLLYETMLDFPDLRADPDFTRQMAQLKRAYSDTYGLLHDHSVEPFRQMLENAINDGTTQLSNLSVWAETQGINVAELSADSIHLFDQRNSAKVIEGSNGYFRDFFIIRTDAKRHNSVYALYPEWEQVGAGQDDKDFQITDLNANGRDEIAITHRTGSAGMIPYCEESFNLYEWDGSTFRDLMADPLDELMGLNFGDCLDITFPPDPRGGQKIQAGTSRNTLCPETPYLNLITFHWDWKVFRQESTRTSPPPITNHPSRCTIDWAITAGYTNDAAVSLLAAALVDWPVEAEEEWGPAARDFLKIKLAVWNINRGRVEQALDLLRQVRNHPAAPTFTFPAQVAATFLDSYTAKGLYNAIVDVRTLYQAEIDKLSLCEISRCNSEKVRQTWGFAEQAWAIDYVGPSPDEFDSIDTLSLTFNQVQPASLDALYAWLDLNDLHPDWSVQANLDGQGQQDWLVDIVQQSGDHTYHKLYAFLRQGGQARQIYLNLFLFDDSSPKIVRWQSFRPDPNAPPVNVFQVGSQIYVFHFSQSNGKYQAKIDLDSSKISRVRDLERVYVQDWKIKDNQLVVTYNGTEGIYTWDAVQGKLVPNGYAPDLQEENVRKAEQALFIDQDPIQAQKILNGLLATRIYENYYREAHVDSPILRPYIMYLLGLAYERSGDQANTVRTYWQLWHDYPACPYSLAAQSRLERK